MRIIHLKKKRWQRTSQKEKESISSSNNLQFFFRVRKKPGTACCETSANHDSVTSFRRVNNLRLCFLGWWSELFNFMICLIGGGLRWTSKKYLTAWRKDPFWGTYFSTGLKPQTSHRLLIDIQRFRVQTGKMMENEHMKVDGSDDFPLQTGDFLVNQPLILQPLRSILDEFAWQAGHCSSGLSVLFSSNRSTISL